jgi:hypothetical protein
MQRDSGIKDLIAQEWIEKLVPKARQRQAERFQADLRLKDRRCMGETRANIKEAIRVEIQTELWTWLLKQPETECPATSTNDGELEAASMDVDEGLSRTETLIDRGLISSLAPNEKLRPGVHYNALLAVDGVFSLIIGI